MQKIEGKKQEMLSLGHCFIFCLRFFCNRLFLRLRPTGTAGSGFLSSCLRNYFPALRSNVQTDLSLNLLSALPFAENNPVFGSTERLTSTTPFNAGLHRRRPGSRQHRLLTKPHQLPKKDTTHVEKIHMSPACLVSVVIPCFNAADYLADAVKSVLAQDVAHTEIIIVDDQSTDDSICVAESLAGLHPGVRLLRQPRRFPFACHR